MIDLRVKQDGRGARLSRLPSGAGFTLIELMVALTVAGILTALAVPAFRTFLQNDRLMTEAFALRASMDLARSEAIKEDAQVTVCPSSDGLTCNATDWSQGWIVLSANGGTPLQVVPPVATGNSVTEKNAYSTVTFTSTGQASLPGAASAAFTICDSRGGGSARYVEVNLMGRTVASSTIGQDLAHNALTCSG